MLGVSRSASKVVANRPTAQVFLEWILRTGEPSGKSTTPSFKHPTRRILQFWWNIIPWTRLYRWGTLLHPTLGDHQSDSMLLQHRRIRILAWTLKVSVLAPMFETSGDLLTGRRTTKHKSRSFSLPLF